VRANVNRCCERSQAHALAYFPMSCAVREANKQDEGVTRATSRSAFMSERFFCGCAVFDDYDYSENSYSTKFTNCSPKFMGGAQPLASEWLRDMCNDAILRHCSFSLPYLIILKLLKVLPHICKFTAPPAAQASKPPGYLP
jgi:hypothetical protein